MYKELSWEKEEKTPRGYLHAMTSNKIDIHGMVILCEIISKDNH